MILRAFTGRDLPLRTMVPIAWVPLVGKYVPGKVAAVGTAVVLMRRLGIAGTAALSSFLLLDALPVISGTVLGSFLLWNPDVRATFPWAPAASIGVLVAGLVCLHPSVFGGLIGVGLKLIRRPPLERVPALRDYLGPSMVFCVQWVFHALSVWAACLAVLPAGQGPGWADFPLLVSITALALVLSYFGAIIAPAGAVVREGAFIVLLSLLIPQPAAVAAAVALRIVNVGLEGVLFTIGLATMKGLRDDASGTDLGAVEQPLDVRPVPPQD
jgi:hypothetical protein